MKRTDTSCEAEARYQAHAACVAADNAHDAREDAWIAYCEHLDQADRSAIDNSERRNVAYAAYRDAVAKYNKAIVARYIAKDKFYKLRDENDLKRNRD